LIKLILYFIDRNRGGGVRTKTVQANNGKVV